MSILTSTRAVSTDLDNSYHSTFYYNQLISLHLLVGDIASAHTAVDTYIANHFQTQIDGAGEQVSPLLAGNVQPAQCFMSACGSNSS